VWCLPMMCDDVWWMAKLSDVEARGGIDHVL
jgi:hypothetical protein